MRGLEKKTKSRKSQVIAVIYGIISLGVIFFSFNSLQFIETIKKWLHPVIIAESNLYPLVGIYINTVNELPD